MGSFFYLSWSADGNYFRVDGFVAQPAADHARHGPRRAAAGKLFCRGPSPLPDTVEINHVNRNGSRADGGAHAAQNSRRISQCGHSTRIHLCLLGRAHHAPPRSRGRAPVSLSDGASGANPWDLLLPAMYFLGSAVYLAAVD